MKTINISTQIILITYLLLGVVITPFANENIERVRYGHEEVDGLNIFLESFK
ncbi:hypothetical protein [Desulforhopalus sp. 52FAK]